MVIIGHDKKEPRNIIKPENFTEETPIFVLGYEIGVHYQSLNGVISSALKAIIMDEPTSSQALSTPSLS